MRHLLVAFVVLLAIDAFAQAKYDSTRKSFAFTVVPRLNSAGYFPFTGALLNHNLNADVNAVFQMKGFGVLAFKSIDLEERKSYINYLQSAVFKQFQINRSVSAGVYAGYVFSQINCFRDDNDSDYFSAVTTNWDVNRKLRIENIALFSDMTIQMKVVDRLVFLYTLKKFRFDLSLHERWVFETASFSTSAALTTHLKLKLNERLSTQFSVTYQNYLTECRPDFALGNGVLFSISVPLDLSR